MRAAAFCGSVAASPCERLLEQRDRVPRLAGRRVGAPQRRIDVGARRGRHELGADHRRQVLDRLGVLAPRCRRQPEQDPRRRRRSDVHLAFGVGEHGSHGVTVELAFEPQPELLLGEAQLAQVRPAELRARLEVLGCDAQLLREHPERLDRRRARAGLDPRDVGVGDARGGEVPLGQAPLAPETAEPRSDRLVGRLGPPSHGPIMPSGRARVNPAMTTDDRIDNKRNLLSPCLRPVFERREEVLVVLISRRVQLALVALASVAAAAWLGGCPWGP